MTNPNPNPRRGTGSVSDDELVILLVVGVLGFSAAVAGAVTWWTTALRWLLEHQVVVAADQHPLVTLPYSAGAGLDIPRVALAAAAGLLLIAVSVGGVRRRLRSRDLS